MKKALMVMGIIVLGLVALYMVLSVIGAGIIVAAAM